MLGCGFRKQTFSGVLGRKHRFGFMSDILECRDGQADFGLMDVRPSNGIGSPEMEHSSP